MVETQNFDKLAPIIENIGKMSDRQKRIVSLVVVGQEKSIGRVMHLTQKSATATLSVIIGKAGIPGSLPSHIRRLYLKAAGLKAIGRDEDAEKILGEIRTGGPAAPRASKKKPAERKKHGAGARTQSCARSTGDAFADEILSHLPGLKAFAISLCGNGDRAKDYVQETVLRALANRNSFQPGSNFPAWLFTILRNLFRSDYRKRRREVEDADGNYAKTLKIQPSQNAHLEFEEFRVALGKLPHDQREALILVGASGFSYEDAAAICQCAVGTIKSRVFRARVRVAELMGFDYMGQGEEYGFGTESDMRAAMESAE